MSVRWRMWSGLALVLTMIGSPMAAVLCAVACPDTVASVRTGIVPVRPVLVARQAPRCHETAAPAATEAAAASADVAHSVPPSGHQCTPQMVVSAARQEGLRVPQPTAVALQGPPSTPYVRPLPARTAAVAADRAPSRPRGPAAPIVLRI